MRRCTSVSVTYSPPHGATVQRRLGGNAQFPVPVLLSVPGGFLRVGLITAGHCRTPQDTAGQPQDTTEQPPDNSKNHPEPQM